MECSYSWYYTLTLPKLMQANKGLFCGNFHIVYQKVEVKYICFSHFVRKRGTRILIMCVVPSCVKSNFVPFSFEIKKVV